MTKHITYTQVVREAESFTANQIAKDSGKPVMLVMSSDREMELAIAQLEAYAPSRKILSLPAWDSLPYDRASPKHSIIAQRLSTLAALIEAGSSNSSQPPILVTTVNAVTQKLPPRSHLQHSTLHLKLKGDLDRDALMRYLIANGYSRVSKAMEPGEFALRGNIIDLFPSGFEEGCRLDLFGDEIESITRFDALSQRSTGEKMQEITLHPVSEVLLDEGSINRFRDAYREEFGAINKPDPFYNSISEAHPYAGMENWLPLFYSHLDSIFDYLPEGAITVFSYGSRMARTDRVELIEDYYKARLEFGSTSDAPYHPLAPSKLYLDEAAWDKLMQKQDSIALTPFDADGGDTHANISQQTRSTVEFSGLRNKGENPFEAAKIYIQSLQKDGKDITLAAISEGSQQSLIDKLALGGQVKSAILPLPRGFLTPTLAIISEQDILGERRVIKRSKRRSSEQFFAEAANFTEGELVVHKEHGIGRFEGLVTMEAGGLKHDCLKLVYAEAARLFLPVENIDLISRYGDVGEDEAEARLDKLGGTNWQARKAKLKERIKMAAQELLKIAAKRNLAKGAILSPPEGLYEEFVQRFPYVETDDQLTVIEDILVDFGSGKPADRLVCGDVGFGKTEVALRAAFVAAAAEEGGTQVALIAPTTLLARQHFKTFAERFAGFPIEIRQLSRLVSAKDKKQTHADIAAGKVDIVIGTHALLSEAVKFKNLGLLIVDEEQHFGVKQKEKLKKLRSEMHVVTLSATPIPRTMQMALTGVRDLSLITTPPVDRLAVRSFVSPFDPVMIREALLREYHRGGQSFYVTPYVKDLAELKHRIHDLVPEISIAVAHGQLAPAELDRLMNEFYDGKYDVLMSTSIIESGIDVPTANTLIINRADRFGLSQLYQLRGRVGRSKTRAYAYLTLPHKRKFSANAMKRLEVMQTLDTLGAGFTVASHDMDIRGFGNLVGEEQSGHIREVGVELYQHMLEEAVRKAREQNKKLKSAEISSEDNEWRPQIKLGLSVLIPEDYITDLDLRLGLYRRAASLKSNGEIEDFRLELADRFGAVPQAVDYFLETLKLKLLCVTANIERLDAGPKGVVVTFHKNLVKNPTALLEFIHRHKNQMKIRPDQKLVITYDASQKNTEQRIALLGKIITKIAHFAEGVVAQAA